MEVFSGKNTMPAISVDETGVDRPISSTCQVGWFGALPPTGASLTLSESGHFGGRRWVTDAPLASLPTPF
jgi:hypothetical protein